MASVESSLLCPSRLISLGKLLVIRSLTDYSGLINSSFDPIEDFLHPASTVSRLEPETPGLREQRCLGDRRRIPARVDSSLGLHFFWFFAPPLILHMRAAATVKRKAKHVSP